MVSPYRLMNLIIYVCPFLYFDFFFFPTMCLVSALKPNGQSTWVVFIPNTLLYSIAIIINSYSNKNHNNNHELILIILLKNPKLENLQQHAFENHRICSQTHRRYFDNLIYRNSLNHAIQPNFFFLKKSKLIHNL